MKKTHISQGSIFLVPGSKFSSLSLYRETYLERSFWHCKLTRGPLELNEICCKCVLMGIAWGGGHGSGARVIWSEKQNCNMGLRNIVIVMLSNHCNGVMTLFLELPLGSEGWASAKEWADHLVSCGCITSSVSPAAILHKSSGYWSHCHPFEWSTLVLCSVQPVHPGRAAPGL